MGTNLITSKDSPSFGGVYKLAAIQDAESGEYIPKIKISENSEKITNPGDKVIYRVYDKQSGKIFADLIALSDEHYDESKDLLLFDPVETWKKTLMPAGSYIMEELMIPVFKGGKCVYNDRPTVMELKEVCSRDKEALWEECKRLVNPHHVHVDLSRKLWDLKQRLLDEYHGI